MTRRRDKQRHLLLLKPRKRKKRPKQKLLRSLEKNKLLPLLRRLKLRLKLQLRLKLLKN
jgi:hypothetical protein